MYSYLAGIACGNIWPELGSLSQLHIFLRSFPYPGSLVARAECQPQALN